MWLVLIYTFIVYDLSPTNEPTGCPRRREVTLSARPFGLTPSSRGSRGTSQMVLSTRCVVLDGSSSLITTINGHKPPLTAIDPSYRMLLEKTGETGKSCKSWCCFTCFTSALANTTCLINRHRLMWKATDWQVARAHLAMSYQVQTPGKARLRSEPATSGTGSGTSSSVIIHLHILHMYTYNESPIGDQDMRIRNMYWHHQVDLPTLYPTSVDYPPSLDLLVHGYVLLLIGWSNQSINWWMAVVYGCSTLVIRWSILF